MINHRKHAALYFGLMIAVAINGINSTWAADQLSEDSRFTGSFGASWSIGSMSSDQMNLPSRSMDAASIEALPAYRVGKFSIGPDFDYRWQGQIASLNSAGGTNLAGHGFVIGLGAIYDVCEKFSLQASFGFLGKYVFSHQTSTTEDDQLTGPISLRIKPQYFFGHSEISLDADFRYFHWNTFTVAATDYKRSTTELSAGLGLSWHFGNRLINSTTESDSDVNSIQKPETRVLPAMSDKNVGTQPVLKEIVTVSDNKTGRAEAKDLQADLAQVVDVTKTERGLLVNVKGDASFKSASAELTPESLTNLQKTAEILSKQPNSKVRIEGHSDSSGKKAKNQILSEARAESVKKVFVANGVAAESVSAVGFGDTKPVKSNKTIQGRAANRRVEIHIEQESQ